MILYLHGFRSTPLSHKAQLIARRMRELGREAEYVCPHLPASPAQAVAMARELVKTSPREQLAVIGSSLGGFYATWLAEETGCRAVLLNPAARPPEQLERYVGVHTEYHTNAPFEFKREYIDELLVLRVERITEPQRYFLVAATGDEVLDWREMVAHYPGVRQRIVEGSDHALSDFDRHLDEVLEFCLPGVSR